MARITAILCAALGLAGCYASHGADGPPIRRDAGPPIGLDAGPPIGRDAGPPRRDAGPAPSCDDVCASEVIHWAMSGGLSFETTEHELSPCDRVLRVIDRMGGALPSHCAASVRGSRCEALIELERLLATDAVRALRAAAPVVVGRDDRPVDGQILVVRIGEDEIGVGGECRTGDPDCRPVPPEMRELAAALARLAAALEEPGVCADEVPAESFECGEGAEAVTCVRSRDVCYLGRYESPRCAVPGPMENMCGGPPRCDCLAISLAESCAEPVPGEVTVRFVGP